MSPQNWLANVPHFTCLLTTIAFVMGWLPSPAAAQSTKQPHVLILGDSISIGYTPFVQKQLEGKARVVRPMRNAKNAENCAGTVNGVKHVDRWLQLDGGEWDVIHFNFGLHDLKRVDATTRKNSNDPNDPYQSDPETYRKQLREITQKLVATGARVVFATTTPVPAGGVKPHRDPKDVERYNEVAREVMREFHVEVNDLYAFALPRLKDIQRPVNVHFSAEGSQALAGQVIQAIHNALASRK